MAKKKRSAGDGVALNPYGVTRMVDVVEERVTWLWEGRIPFGKITLLDGDPGVGKSTLSLDLTARFTRQRAFPGGAPRAEGDADAVLLVSAEDDAGDTIKPRLRAAGAEMELAYTLSLRHDDTGEPLPFSVPEDLPRLEGALRKTRAKFVVIDPVAAYLSETVQSHNDSSVRKAMTPLTVLAQETGAAFLLLRHLNKDASNGKAMYRGGGSIGFTGSARSVLLAAPKPDDEKVRVLAQTKGNLSRGRVPSLEWRVDPWPRDEHIPHIAWLGESELDADALLRAPDSRKDAHARDEAGEFLKQVLADGPQRVRQLQAEAHEAGISKATLDRAGRAIGLHRYRLRSKDGKTAAWSAHLPDQPCPAECHQKSA